MAITTEVEKNNTLANALDVKDSHGPIQVPRGSTQLQWHLVGTAAQLQFYPLNDPNYPGFKWLDSPPYGTFDPPTLLGNSQILQINDNNTGAGGPWRYQLNAHDNMGVRYSTIAASPTATTTDPKIKNS